MWEIASRKEARALPLPTDYRQEDALFSPEGLVLVGTRTCKVMVYLPSGGSQTFAGKRSPSRFHGRWQNTFDYSSQTVYVWDWPACTQRAAIAMDREPESAAISTDGKKAVIGKGANAVLIDLVPGRPVVPLPFRLHWFSRVAAFGSTDQMVCGVTETYAASWSFAEPSNPRKFQTPPTKKSSYLDFHGFAMSADGWRSASCQNDGNVTIYETATGEVLAHFEGHRGSLFAVTFTPEGDRVLSAGDDHQVLVWDVSLRSLAGKVTPLSPAERLQAWEQLGSQKAKVAVRTMAALAADPEATVAHFAAKMKPWTAADPAVLDRIFRDFNDAKFSVREKAERDLHELGPGAIGGVRQRLATAAPLEVQQRAEKFLLRFDVQEMTPDRIRFIRALEVLAAAKTKEARKLVENLAGGAPGAWETDVALRALINSGISP